MTTDQIERIPNRLLYQSGTSGLREWLNARGLSMSLLELHNERHRRQEVRR